MLLLSYSRQTKLENIGPILNYPSPGTALPTLCRNISHQVFPVHTLRIKRCYIFEFKKWKSFPFSYIVIAHISRRIDMSLRACI